MPLIRVVTFVLLLLPAGIAAAQCVSNVQELSTDRSILPGPIAWSGRVLAMAGIDSVTTRVFVTTFDSSGTQLSPLVDLPESSGADILALLWNGEDFGLFLKNSSGNLILRRVSTTGQLEGSPIRPIRLNLDADEDAEIIWSPIHHRYLIARISADDRPSVWLTTIEADGDSDHNIMLDTVGAREPLEIAVTDAGTIGVFYKGDKGDFIDMQIAEPSQAIGSPVRVWRIAEEHAVVAKGNWFVLVRSGEATAVRDRIEWKWVDTSGAEVRAEDRIALVKRTPEMRPLVFLSTPEGFALAYLDEAASSDDLRLRRLSLAGETIADTEFAPSSRRRSDFLVENLIFDGQTFVAAGGLDSEMGIDDASILRWCPLRARIEAPRTARPGETVTFTAVAEGGVRGYAYSWSISNVTGAGRMFERTFDVPGSYTVVLLVRDDSFTYVTETFTIDVVEEPAEEPRRRRAVRK